MQVRSAILGQILAFVALAAISDGGDSSNDPTARTRSDDALMLAAYAKASEQWPRFVAAFRNPPPGVRNFVVKVSLSRGPDGKGFVINHPGPHSGDDVEYFWVKSLSIVGDNLRGALANDGVTVTDAHLGQTIAFSRVNVADWMYRKDGRIVGNATLCPEIRPMPAAEARALLNSIGASCP